jgi:alkane 1-monooxygenase
MRLAPHLLALAFPLFTSIFVVTAPHSAPVAIPFVAALVAAIALDASAGPRRAAPRAGPRWAFDGVLYAAAALQLANVAGLALAAARMGAVDLATGILLVGTSSGYSAIVVAHELVHRPERHFRALGRVLLGTVLYDHFATEHVRGHHKRVGTAEDPATARYGERLWPFVVRAVPGQLASAWRLESRRLGDPQMRLADPRQRANRVLHGLLLEWSALGLATALLGPVAGLALGLQAMLAILLLETVNYVEHWGIRRAGARPTTVDAWDAESWFTYYTLVGLSRHADHHANAARPWHALRHFDESPKMPWGYWATVTCAIFANARLRDRLAHELAARGLGGNDALRSDPGADIGRHLGARADARSP